jgi:hypothetical protein
MQHFVRVIISAVSLLVLASCGQQTPTVANPPGSSQLTAQAAVSGLTGQYYDLSDFTGPALTRVDTTIDFAWGNGAPLAGIQPTTYAVAWTGQIQAPTTEEYTFFVTSGGGARLMVNGQVVTSNWTDHAVTTDSGKVKMVTGQKVDVRLEYYRNTANPGTIKLEWSSATRARAVVPATALLSSGTNLDLAITALRSSPLLNAQTQYDITKSIVSVNANGLWASVRETGQRAAVVVGIQQGILTDLYRFFPNAQGELIVSNLNTGKSTSLGGTSTIFDASGNISQSNLRLISGKLIVLLSDGILKSSSTATQSTGVLRPKLAFLCDLVDAPPAPPSCPSGDCGQKSTDYRDTVCNTAAGIATLGVWGLRSGVLDWFSGGVAFPNFLDAFNYDKRLADAWQAYMDCINGKSFVYVGGVRKDIPGCPPEMTAPTPNPVNVIDIVNNSGSVTVSFSRGIKPGGALEVFISGASSDLSPSTISLRLATGTGPSDVDLKSGSRFRLRDTQPKSFSIIYKCPSTAAIGTWKITLTHNATNIASPIAIPVTIKCKGVYLPNEVAFEMYACGGGAAIVSNGITVGSSHDYCFSTYSAYSGPGFNRSLYLLPSTNTADPYTLAKWTAVCTTAEGQFDKCRGADARQANTHVAEALNVWKSRLKPGLTYEVVKGSVSIANPYDYNTARIRVNISD